MIELIVYSSFWNWPGFSWNFWRLFNKKKVSGWSNHYLWKLYCDTLIRYTNWPHIGNRTTRPFLILCTGGICILLVSLFIIWITLENKMKLENTPPNNIITLCFYKYYKIMNNKQCVCLYINLYFIIYTHHLVIVCNRLYLKLISKSV